jgi:hypothetical protein
VRCDSGDCHHQPPKCVTAAVSSRFAVGAATRPTSRQQTRANAIRCPPITAPAMRPNNAHTRPKVPTPPHEVEELKFIFCIQKKFFQDARMLTSEFTKTRQTDSN